MTVSPVRKYHLVNLKDGEIEIRTFKTVTVHCLMYLCPDFAMPVFTLLKSNVLEKKSTCYRKYFYVNINFVIKSSFNDNIVEVVDYYILLLLNLGRFLIF